MRPGHLVARNAQFGAKIIASRIIDFFHPAAWLFGLFVLCFFFGLKGAHAAGKGQVVVYDWPDYIPGEVLDNFTRETGIKVAHNTFESHEAAYVGKREDVTGFSQVNDKF